MNNFRWQKSKYLTLTLYIRGLYAPLRNSTQNSFKKSLTLKAERRSEEWYERDSLFFGTLALCCKKIIIHKWVSQQIQTLWALGNRAAVLYYSQSALPLSNMTQPYFHNFHEKNPHYLNFELLLQVPFPYLKNRETPLGRP